MSARPTSLSLLINIDHVATLRNAREGKVPDPVEAARVCMRAGADGIGCHLREDRRHIRDRDVEMLRESVTTKLDLEMAATPDIIRIALRLRPELVTLVPERRRELTTEGGLDVVRRKPALAGVVERFHGRDIAVSLFVDPSRRQIAAAAATGADYVEMHTGAYADARTAAGRRRQLVKLKEAAAFARTLGLGVNAGHGLDYANITPVVGIRGIEEVSIGHAIIVHALEVGVERAVR